MPIGLRISCSISLKSVEHVKNSLQNIKTEQTPPSVQDKVIFLRSKSGVHATLISFPRLIFSLLSSKGPQDKTTLTRAAAG